MTFFYSPPPGFTHRARFYGIPCFIRDDGDMTVLGTNWLFDKMIDWLVPPVHFVVNLLYHGIYGEDLEGFPIKIVAELPEEEAA